MALGFHKSHDMVPIQRRFQYRQCVPRNLNFLPVELF